MSGHKTGQVGVYKEPSKKSAVIKRPIFDHYEKLAKS